MTGIFIGLGIDLLGVLLVAWELIRPYKGQRIYYADTIWSGAAGAAEAREAGEKLPDDPMTEEFKRYERRRLCRSRLGVICIGIGTAVSTLSNLPK